MGQVRCCLFISFVPEGHWQIAPGFNLGHRLQENEVL